MFLLTKHGVEAKNYENLGDAAKLKPLEVCLLPPSQTLNMKKMFCFLQVELKRLEDLSESIVQDFNYMRQREVGHSSDR